MDESFYVSAPGKVILLGEHSVVYGKPAIAAALSLRAFFLVSPSDDSDTIRLEFPDIKLSYSWDRKSLPFDEVKQYAVQDERGLPKTTEDLVPEVVEKISDLLSNVDNSLHYNACMSFLYMYLHLCNAETPGKNYCVRSTVPIGAGLGSSACTSVCIATALAILGGHIEKPKFGVHDKVSNSTDAFELDLIDSWSLMGEKTFHGNPSGIDNAVATHGGAVMFQRMTNPSQPSVRTTMRNFPPLKLLLTNTKVPRSTADLVGNVSKINSEYGNIIGPVLDAMGDICHSAYQLMIKPTFDDESKSKLKQLADINHGLLVSLGVSNPALEEVRLIGQKHKIGVTKLTGAGGGGCAITLVHDDTTQESIDEVMAQYQQKGFECYETSLGGKGVGALFENDSKPEVFSFEQFSKFKTRQEIEGALSIDQVDGWKFW